MNEKVEKISDWGLLILAVANLVLWIVAGNLGGILGWCGAVVTVFIYLTCKAGLKAKIDDLLDGVEIQNLQDEVDFYKRRADEAIRIADDVREIARKSLDHASDVNANNKLYNEDAKNLYEVIMTLQEYVPGKEEYEKLNSRIWSTGYVFRENQEKGTWDLYVCRDRRPKEKELNGE